MENKPTLFSLMIFFSVLIGTIILSVNVLAAIIPSAPGNYSWSTQSFTDRKFVFSIDNATGIDANCTLYMAQVGGLVNQYGVVNQTSNNPTLAKFGFSNHTAINLTANNANVSGGYASGLYKWNISCINNSDTAGGVVTTNGPTNWFLYDAVAPTGNISTPANKSYINTLPIHLNATINDSYSGPNVGGIVSLRLSNSTGACWQWNNNTWGSCNSDPTNPPPGPLPADMALMNKTLKVNSSNFNISYVMGKNISHITLSDDEYNFVIYAGDSPFDGLGNPNYGVVNISFVYDTTPPVAAIYSVNLFSNNSWTNSRVVKTNLTVTDRATDHFNLSLYDSASAIQNSTNITTGNATAILFNITAASDGTYTLNLTAVDNATNKNSTVPLFYIRVDATIPNSTIFSVSGSANNSWINTRALRINLTAADVNINYFNVTINATNSTNISTGGVYDTLYNISVGSDATYRINLTTVDNASNINSSPAFYVRVDATVPTSSINNISKKVNNSWTNNRMLAINFTASDTNIKNWSIYVYNTTDIFNSSPSGWNYTYYESNTSAEVNFSAPRDGTYFFNLTTNDNATNANTTAKLFYIRVDATNPSIGTPSFSGISSSGATLSVEMGETNLDACTYSGGSTGTLTCSGGTCSASLSGLSASIIYSYSVACTDLAGNSATGASNSFMTSSASSGSGSGGSGGGSGSSVAGQFSKKVWSSLNAGETATVKVAEGDGIGATEVSFKVDKTSYGVIADVKKVDKTEVPAEIGGKKVHNYLKIAVTGAIKEENIKEGKIIFKVAKKWLTDNAMTKEKVALYRYADNKWNALSTKMTQEDETTVYYSADTPGFSYFAIAESEVAAEAPVSVKEEQPVEEAPATETPVEEAPAEEAPAEAPVESKTWLWIVLAVVLAAIIAAIYFWPKKKGKGF